MHPAEDAPAEEWREFLKDLTYEDCEGFGRCECGQRLAGHPPLAPWKPLGDRYEQIPVSLRSAARQRAAQEINVANPAGYEEHRSLRSPDFAAGVLRADGSVDPALTKAVR